MLLCHEIVEYQNIFEMAKSYIIILKLSPGIGTKSTTTIFVRPISIARNRQLLDNRRTNILGLQN